MLDLVNKLFNNITKVIKMSKMNSKTVDFFTCEISEMLNAYI